MYHGCVPIAPLDAPGIFERSGHHVYDPDVIRVSIVFMVTQAHIYT